MPKKTLADRLSLQVSPELKQTLRDQAKTAGMPLSEWVRTRLELGIVDPAEVRAFLVALKDLGERVSRANAEMDAQRTAWEASKREAPAREAAARAAGERWAAEHGFVIPPSGDA